VPSLRWSEISGPAAPKERTQEQKISNKNGSHTNQNRPRLPRRKGHLTEGGKTNQLVSPSPLTSEKKKRGILGERNNGKNSKKTSRAKNRLSFFPIHGNVATGIDRKKKDEKAHR